MFDDPIPPPLPYPIVTRHSVVRRPRRRKSYCPPILKLWIGIVAGGAVGLTIGQLILWWVIGIDSFQMGPKVSKWAPDMVPAQFSKGGTK